MNIPNQPPDTELIPVEIKNVEEPWTVITLVDGSVIKTRLIITSANAIYDTNGNHLKAPDGQLLYAIEHTMVHKTISSPLLLMQSGTKQ